MDAFNPYKEAWNALLSRPIGLLYQFLFPIVLLVIFGIPFWMLIELGKVAGPLIGLFVSIIPIIILLVILIGLYFAATYKIALDTLKGKELCLKKIFGFSKGKCVKFVFLMLTLIVFAAIVLGLLGVLIVFGGNLSALFLPIFVIGFIGIEVLSIFASCLLTTQPISGANAFWGALNFIRQNIVDTAKYGAVYAIVRFFLFLFFLLPDSIPLKDFIVIIIYISVCFFLEMSAFAFLQQFQIEKIKRFTNNSGCAEA